MHKQESIVGDHRGDGKPGHAMIGPRRGTPSGRPRSRPSIWCNSSCLLNLLEKILDDNQSNLAALFDGGASDRALQSMA